MPRSSTRNHHHHNKSFHQIASEQIWPDETIVVLPETPRVRLSPRRKLHGTPGWPPANIMGDTIRMYHDPEDQDETVNFTMNPDFIESTSLPLSCAVPSCLASFFVRGLMLFLDMHSFIPPVSPSKIRMLSPSKAGFEDDVIEIPDNAGLSDETRDAIFNVWVTEDLDEDSAFVEGMHYIRVLLLLNICSTDLGLSSNTT